MCSIIGYLGISSAAPIIVKGLKRMEYRGYDSVGVATFSEDQISVRKGVGKVIEVNKAAKLDELSGTIGIGHTRWATHGMVTDTNAHPHPSSSGEIAIVHNGIIENHEELKKDLQELGYNFKSQTDSEVIANLLQYNYDKTKEIKKSIIDTVAELKGNYAFVAVFQDGTLAAARLHEPLIIGVGKEGYFISSDVLGFVEYTDEVIYPDNKEFVIIDRNGLKIFDFDANPVRHQITKVSKEFADAYKGQYAHYTLKEISEQPTTILNAGNNTKLEIDLASDLIKHARNVYITGSGTSYNAALIAKFLFSKYAKIKVEPLISSEAQFSPDIFEEKSILIAISQSGESADVLEAVSIAKKTGSKIISVVNMMTSSLVHQSSISMGLNCGPEIGVAATKSFTSQLVVLYKMVDKICDGCIELDLTKVSEAIKKIISNDSKIKDIAKRLKDVSDIYVLGRGIHYPIASEGSLKLKELTYIHAEGLPGGELKHGPLALMDINSYVLIINPNDSTYNDTLTSAREIKARGAKIIGISDKPSDVYDYWIDIPSINESLYPLVEIVPIQLLAYYAAIDKDFDPDYPRNLAKSVTVK
ncbi:Glutamine--fructose-6-phosphate aminotransferase [isomerizing] [Candidatus Nitrosotalea sp. FS]|uniref:glutamine--fructose-6-phosphate transaminase (isomerizing) n=1 Tax=Candidatus Nitrosotalea sp. FS TaxID=2341021 RepID=UPI00140B8795|nr:glutamine--fructose-6-phosphate transaminase (isomerizing) [Candidatus Nitrosotalea sp. FS]NHH98646.1 Glutamine--fructose-6-phosphate aminotransferase [isomerizing] [Candidatus Nitrosotalea sp. FS]